MDGVNQLGQDQRRRDRRRPGQLHARRRAQSRRRDGQGRTVGPDAEPEKGIFYRSDHFEFAKQGVPALDPRGASTTSASRPGYGKKKRDEYTEKDYHKPTDEVKPDWDLSGGGDLRALFQVGYRGRRRIRCPQWKPGTEFKAMRDSMLRDKTLSNDGCW